MMFPNVPQMPTPPIRPVLLVALALLVACALAACGAKSTKTSVVTETVTRTVATTPSTTPTPPSTAGTTVPPPNPNAPLTLRDAEAVLARRGYAALTERDFRPDQKLKVLVGVRRSSASGHQQQAFFFVGNRFIGTDTSDPSGSIAVTDQRAGAITITYQLYKPDDALSNPTDGQADVTYRWTGAKLVPTGTIPPSSPQVAHSRR